MGKISFIDNNFEYAKGFVGRDYSEIAAKISGMKDDMDYYTEDKGTVYSYKIAKNNPVSELYGGDYYSVRFYFANIDTLHDESQEENILKMLEDLDKKMSEKTGYFNLRIPTHIIDLVKAYNRVFDKTIFCGGTVEEYIYGKSVPDNNKNNLKIFYADPSYGKKFEKELLDMTYSSFETYQGQYHISYVTDKLAGKIYENWIKNSLTKESSDKMVVAELDGEPIGFVTTAEDDFAVEGILSAVSSKHRQYGAYRAMIAHIINYANDNGKAFITSTQFDNFIVQGVWNSLGLKPFYSIYNIHIDRRND